MQISGPARTDFGFAPLGGGLGLHWFRELRGTPNQTPLEVAPVWLILILTNDGGTLRWRGLQVVTPSLFSTAPDPTPKLARPSQPPTGLLTRRTEFLLCPSLLLKQVKCFFKNSDHSYQFLHIFRPSYNDSFCDSKNLPGRELFPSGILSSLCSANSKRQMYFRQCAVFVCFFDTTVALVTQAAFFSAFSEN